MLGNKPIYGLDSHLKPTCQAAAHPLSTLQSLGNISNQPALHRKNQQHEKSISYIWYFELYDVWSVKMCEDVWCEDVWWSGEAKNCQ